MDFLKEPVLDKIYFGFWCNSIIINDGSYMKFSLNFQNILTCFELYMDIFSVQIF